MIYTKDNARFSVITEGVVRMEYAADGVFVDGETLFARRDMLWDAAVTDGDVLTVSTDCFTLYYHGGEFTGDTLYADVHTDGVVTRWHYGDESTGNLGGTLHTLDGVDGFRPLPDGLISRDGWYVIDDSSTPFFKDGWIENRSDAHRADLYLFAYGHNYKGALSDLAAVSGRFALPRKYFFGSWYSRWWPYTAEDFLSIADQYEENGFPLDIMVMDMDWHCQDWGREEGEPLYSFGYGHAGGNLGWTGYTWNRRLIPDPESTVKALNDRGIAVVLNDHPADGVRDADEVYESFMAMLDEAGYREKVPTVEERVNDREREHVKTGVRNYRFNAGDKDYMDAFFCATGSEMEEKGAAFRWLDWQQDYIYPNVNGMKDLSHLKWLNHLYYEHSRKGGKRGMSFSRWGGFGDHKHPAYFSGDTHANWDTLAFQVQMTVSAGNAGCFWWSHDIGGFMDFVPGGQGELYARWVQFGALSPAMRLHMCGVEGFDRRPWTWDERYCSVMREAFRLRSALMPYVYSQAKLSSDLSVPLLRAMYYDFPEYEEAYLHPGQYFFGEGLLVSPVCRSAGDDGYAESEVYVPEGVWYDCFTSEPYGAGLHKVRNTLDTFPLFVKAGYPLITRPYTARMATAATEEMTVTVYAGEDGASSLYEDDGVSDPDMGVCRITSVLYEDSTRTVTLTPVVTAYDDGVEQRRVTVKLHCALGVTDALCDSASLSVVRESDSVISATCLVSPDEALEIRFV